MSEIDHILESYSASFWLKDALRSALERDPVDALKDAETLLRVLKRHTDTSLAPDGPMDSWNTDDPIVGQRVLCDVGYEPQEGTVLAVSRRRDGTIKVQFDDGQILVGNQWEEL